MTGPQTHDELRDQLQGLVGGLADDIYEQFQRMADLLNDAAGAFDWKYVVFGPIGGLIIDGLTSDDVERAIDRFNNDIQPKVWEAINGLGADLRNVVDSLAGDPAGLKQLSYDYADCRAALLVPGPSIAQETMALSRFWEGAAQDAYALVANEQSEALADLTNAMEAASQNTNRAGQEILQLWADLIDNIVGFLVDVVDVLADATTVDKILSFEVPAVLAAVAKILKFAQSIAKTLEDFMIRQGFEDALSWHMLNNGADGLPRNTWPVIHPQLVSTLDQPTEWTPK